ncbi:acyl-CoA thioesterase [Caldibacillus lycopersici]|uniref:Acyl-CoA thioesterase n=1 Tax=Perspicuibacillus lycopersici TaxID=1325689 RepID=A0AAE3IU59_9BACI|nr:thioesterase family protein [Perspicuibacillus lycopersici]MCU9614690.1 acyl-CoA thioesterase [Perspicuibacillus lycopersici]
MFVSTTEVTVRYSETDQMGVVYHANYVIWLELGRTKLIEDLGFRYADMEKEGILAPVTDIQVSYKKPCKYGETVTVKTWIESYDGLRTKYGYEILTESGEVAVTGTSSHVCVKKETFRPVSVRRLFPDWHAAYEKAKKQ